LHCQAISAWQRRNAPKHAPESNQKQLHRFAPANKSWLWQQQRIKEPDCANNRDLDPAKVAATAKSLLCVSTIAGSAAAVDQQKAQQKQRSNQLRTFRDRT